MSEEALGFIETRGYAAMTLATDAMHKAAAVSYLDCVQIGSAYVTILVRGDVAAVKAAVNAGLGALDGRLQLVGSNVIPQPHPEIAGRFVSGGFPEPDEDAGTALGLIETKGLAALITAHDAALKAAAVSSVVFLAVGSGLVTIVLRGDVAAVKAAVAAGTDALDAATSLNASLVIPSPHPSLVPTFTDALGEDAPRRAGAVGVVETRGFTGAFAAADAGFKAAAVEPEAWKKIGGGLVSIAFGGDVAAVQTAIEAGAEAARAVAELTAVLLIPRPHEAVYAEMP